VSCIFRTAPSSSPPRPSPPWHAGRSDPGPRDRPRDPRLSAAEERALAEAVARGDADARDRFIRANLALVTVIARQYRGKGLDLDDLIGEGHLGLIAAVERFDPAAGVRFGTYATYCIRTAIRDGLTQTASTIRLPAHVVGLRARWRKVERELGRELGHAPTAEQVAGALGLTDSQREMIEQARRAHGVRVGGGEPEDDAAWAPEPADTQEGPGSAAEAADEERGVRARLGRLDERSRRVVELRFGLGGEGPLTLREVGQRLGLRRERVRQIEKRAIARLGEAPAARVWQ
jgi:RNA polymerase primary sigma factor